MNHPRFVTLTNFMEEKPVIPPPPVSSIQKPPPLEEITFPPVVSKKLYYETTENEEQEMIELAGTKVLMNPEKGNAYSVVSNRYQTIPYKTTLEMIEEAVQANSEFGNYQRTIHFMSDGGKMVAKYRFTDHEIPVGNNHDLVNPEIYVRRSYDTVWGFVLLLGAFRHVCSNGLVVGEKVLEYKHKHTTGLDQKILLESLKGSMDRFYKQVRVWQEWMDRMTTPDDYEKVMNTLDLGERHTRAIENEVEISSHITLDAVRTKTLSYWMLFNIISQYITHRVTRRGEPNYLRQEGLYDRMRIAFRE